MSRRDQAYPAWKALTIWQPYATLIAMGIKRIETRSWYTDYRGPLVIHAAAKRTALLHDEFADMQLTLLGEHEGALDDLRYETLPRRCAVAVVDLVDCVQMTPDVIEGATETERRCGWWDEGRYAWVLEDAKPVNVPMGGAQGLFTVDGALRDRVGRAMA